MNIISELNWRGLAKQITNESKLLEAQKGSKAVYCGFDPTASSLHVGHLMMIVTLQRFGKAGFKPIALIGGGTGMIGDPSFKSDERVLQTNEQVLTNVKAIEKQLRAIIPNVTFANNADWLNKMSLIDFLRDVGKDFTLSYLLAKESIATRIQTGLSITEFSYTMLQAYDFWHLYSNMDCKVQIGGSDQWGNITSGTDYINSKVGRDNSQAAGFTIPLLVKSDGKKFGKTESGAVWLDATKTSEYEFYQFWINQDDADCERMMKYLTFLSSEEIVNLQTQHNQAPTQRIMQKQLASEITRFVHQQDGLDKAIKLTEAFFQGNITNLDKSLLKDALLAIPSTTLKAETAIIDAIVASKCASSKREAREFMKSNAITFNDIIVNDENLKLSAIPLLENEFILIKRGKRKYFGIKIS
ncbi:tyrosine--tRNA ligase [Mesoplasma syrphidae]|uniref:Tyrosine--tRNA ligase n=1 Tax=Mesoplasma syrphidae TaxID=225999 RepID=A0A2K9C8M3_9MOLU|nr:tyrosine--tRNA ligase [Mesoplasma syrphidae]AUF83365.1 tyrosine--tRNA ligase [Mesoplasma syrphidae]